MYMTKLQNTTLVNKEKHITIVHLLTYTGIVATYLHVYEYVQNCSNVVSASLECFSTDPAHGSELPPNMVTSVTPSTRQKAVVVCTKRGCSVTSI